MKKTVFIFTNRPAAAAARPNAGATGARPGFFSRLAAGARRVGSRIVGGVGRLVSRFRGN